MQLSRPPGTRDPRPWITLVGQSVRAWPSWRQGSAGAAKQISQRSLPSARTAAVRPRRVRRHAAGHSSARSTNGLLPGQGKPRKWFPRSRHEKGKQGARGMPLRFGPLVEPQSVRGRRSDSGAKRSGTKITDKWDGVGSGRSARLLLVAPSARSSTGRFTAVEAWLLQRPAAATRCSSSFHPVAPVNRWRPYLLTTKKLRSH